MTMANGATSVCSPSLSVGADAWRGSGSLSRWDERLTTRLSRQGRDELTEHEGRARRSMRRMGDRRREGRSRGLRQRAVVCEHIDA